MQLTEIERPTTMIMAVVASYINKY